MSIENIIKKAEEHFSVQLKQTSEHTQKKLICWKEDGLELNEKDYKNCFQSPVLYLEEGAKKIPTKSAIQKDLYSYFLASNALAGFGNAYNRVVKTNDYLLFFFASLQSPTAGYDNEGNFKRDHIVTGSITVKKMDEGLLWGFWPDDNLFSDYNAYINKICAILDYPSYQKDSLKRGKLAFVHEEPDCNWSQAPSF